MEIRRNGGKMTINFVNNLVCLGQALAGLNNLDLYGHGKYHLVLFADLSGQVVSTFSDEVVADFGNIEEAARLIRELLNQR
jgi:hypothetical protein